MFSPVCQADYAQRSLRRQKLDQGTLINLIRCKEITREPSFREKKKNLWNTLICLRHLNSISYLRSHLDRKSYSPLQSKNADLGLRLSIEGEMRDTVDPMNIPSLFCHFPEWRYLFG